jgi:hypothetical protein
MSRLARHGALLRVDRGIYVQPVESRFGVRAPSTVQVVEGLANQVEKRSCHMALLPPMRWD